MLQSAQDTLLVTQMPFIRSGDPNGKDLNGEPLPRWEAWSEAVPCTMRFLRDGAVPATEKLPPLKAFLSERIMDRVRALD